MALRAIPKLLVVRPADGNETAAAWRLAIERRDGPTVLAFSRQAAPHLAHTAERAPEGLQCGAYVVSEAQGGSPEAIIIGTGTEVSLAVDAQALLHQRGVPTRVVSMPCWELFEAQDQGYRDEVLPPSVRCRVSVEAGVTLGWERWVGTEGARIGIDGRFGASAPYKTIMRELGFTAENVADKALALVERLGGVRA
jgi:transketolase